MVEKGRWENERKKVCVYLEEKERLSVIERVRQNKREGEEIEGERGDCIRNTALNLVLWPSLVPGGARGIAVAAAVV